MNRFYCEFPSIKGVYFKIYIDDEDFAGTATDVDVASDGFQLSYDGDEDVLASIIASRLQVTIAVTEDVEAAVNTFAADLITSAEERFTMRVTRNDGSGHKLFWCGYVLPDLSGFQDKFPPYGFRVTASDGIARLKNVDYNDGADPAEPVGVDSFLTHILRCLTKGSLHTKYYTATEEYLATAVNWVDANIGTPTATKCPLAYTRVNGEVFARRNSKMSADEWRFDSCFEVLETILTNWQCRLLFSDGKFRIEQVAERSQDNHFERRFSYDGTLRSSTNTMSADILVQQNTLNQKLAGNIFNFMPAVKRVTATWEHLTIKNQLAGAGGKWIGGSGQLQTVTIKSIETDGNTRFVLIAGVSMQVNLGATYSAPWRYVVGIEVRKGSQYLKSNTFSLQNGSGDYLQQVSREPIDWVGTAAKYQVSSNYNTSDFINYIEVINIEIDNIPTGSDDIVVAFVPIGAFDLEDDAMISPVLLSWGVKAPQLYILDSTDQDSFLEQVRTYEIENDEVGNSDFVEFDLAFGVAVQGWTISKLQTTSNLSTWTDSAANWDRGTAANNLEFGGLWVNEVMALRKFPTKTYQGSFLSKAAQAHSRLAFDFDDSAWLLMRGTFTAREMIWNGSWMSAGVNATDIDTIKIKKKAGLTPPPLADPEFIRNPGGFNPTTGAIGIDIGNVSMTALTANFIGATIPAGAITSLPVRETIPAGAFLDGDNIFVYDPASGQLYPATVSTTSENGDTAIAIESITTTEDIPAGSVVLYSVMNKQTQTGGVPSAHLPEGTADNDVLLWDSATQTWYPYAGTTDGYVLTYNPVTGWQEGPPGAGPQGPQGSQGAAGAQGAQGSQGGAGAQGFQGFQGSAGAQGSQGVAGAQGSQGFQGNAGPQGSQGSAGAQGFQGVSGAQGAQGFQGNVGAQGPQGVQGAQGSGGLTGSGSPNHIVIWSGASSLSYDSSPLYFDGVNDRLGVNTASPTATVHAITPSGSNLTGLTVQGNMTGNYSASIQNTNTSNGAANAFMDVQVAATAAGDPAFRLLVSGGGQFSMGIDNSDSDKLKLKSSTHPSGSPANSGLTMTTAAIAKIGVNNDNPTYDLDVANTTRSKLFINTNNPPTIQPNTGMGTGPSAIGVIGGQNCFHYFFTTGTSPAPNAVIFQVILSYPNYTIPVFSPGNANTANSMSEFRVESAGNGGFNIRSNGGLSANTAYSLFFIVMGF